MTNTHSLYKSGFPHPCCRAHSHFPDYKHSYHQFLISRDKTGSFSTTMKILLPILPRWTPWRIRLPRLPKQKSSPRESASTSVESCMSILTSRFSVFCLSFPEFRGTQTTVDLNRPIDKRVYKGTFPTCHNFNQQTATKGSCQWVFMKIRIMNGLFSLIIGFSAGQIQKIDPFRKEFTSSQLYNEERFVDKTAVTCLKWVPGAFFH